MSRKASVSETRRTVKKTNEEKITAAIAQLDQIKPSHARTAKAIALFKSWLADQSGYDEETWPKLRRALDRERERVGARRLFDG